MTSKVSLFTAVAAVLALASSLGLITFLEASPESPPLLDSLRAFIFPGSPTGEVAVSAPSLFDFSRASQIIAWAIASGVVALLCLLIALWKGPDGYESRRRAVSVIASLLTLVCLAVLFPALLLVYREAFG